MPPTVTNLSPAQEETQRLATILETGQMLADTIQVKDAMSRVLAILGRHHGMMRGLVMLLDLIRMNYVSLPLMAWMKTRRGGSSIKLEKASQAASPNR